MDGLQSRVEIHGQIVSKEMSGDKSDLSVVKVGWIGATFTVYADNDLYNGVGVGDEVKLKFSLILDPDARGNNKFKVAKGSLVFEVVAKAKK